MLKEFSFSMLHLLHCHLYLAHIHILYTSPTPTSPERTSLDKYQGASGRALVVHSVAEASPQLLSRKAKNYVGLHANWCTCLLFLQNYTHISLINTVAPVLNSFHTLLCSPQKCFWHISMVFYVYPREGTTELINVRHNSMSKY